MMIKLGIAGVVFILASGCTTVALDSMHAKNDQTLDGIENFKTMCIFENTPNAEYETIRKFKVGKGTYGPVSSVMPRYVAYADRLGGNTITNYHGGQRFGFWPWRIVRPVAAGTAVKWKEKTDVKCKTLGGRVYAIQSDEKVWDITDKIKNTVN
jgi:hypothetical protein